MAKKQLCVSWRSLGVYFARQHHLAQSITEKRLVTFPLIFPHKVALWPSKIYIRNQELVPVFITTFVCKVGTPMTWKSLRNDFYVLSWFRSVVYRRFVTLNNILLWRKVLVRLQGGLGTVSMMILAFNVSNCVTNKTLKNFGQKRFKWNHKVFGMQR